MRTSLFIGGPMDGELLTLEVARQLVYVAEVGETSPADSVNEWDALVAESLDVKQTVYRPEWLNFFGMPIQVHIHESLDGVEQSDLAEALGQHLLSDKAKAVVVT